MPQSKKVAQKEKTEEVIVTVEMEQVNSSSKEPNIVSFAPLQIYPQDLKKLEEKF